MCWVVVCYLGLPLSGHDVNVIGGIKINEPSADLVVLLAVISLSRLRLTTGYDGLWGKSV